MMKFDYKKYSTGHYRPVVPVELVNGDERFSYGALVDSGADFCIFDAQIGEALGIDIKSVAPKELGGISQGRIKYYTHELLMKIGGHPLKAEVAFSYEIPKYGYGVLGQIGFFDQYIVKFDYAKKEIQLFDREISQRRSRRS